MLAVCIHREYRVDARRESERMCKAALQCSALAAVLMMAENMVSTTRLRCGAGSVGRTVVHDDDLEVGTLRAHTLHHGDDRIRRLVGRDHARRAQHQPRGLTGEVSSRRISRSSTSIACHVATTRASRALGFSSPALRSSSSRRLAPSMVYFSV